MARVRFSYKNGWPEWNKYCIGLTNASEAKNFKEAKFYKHEVEDLVIVDRTNDKSVTVISSKNIASINNKMRNNEKKYLGLSRGHVYVYDLEREKPILNLSTGKELDDDFSFYPPSFRGDKLVWDEVTNHLGKIYENGDFTYLISPLRFMRIFLMGDKKEIQSYGIKLATYLYVKDYNQIAPDLFDLNRIAESRALEPRSNVIDLDSSRFTNLVTLYDKYLEPLKEKDNEEVIIDIEPEEASENELALALSNLPPNHDFKIQKLSEFLTKGELPESKFSKSIYCDLPTLGIVSVLADNRHIEVCIEERLISRKDVIDLFIEHGFNPDIIKIYDGDYTNVLQ